VSSVAKSSEAFAQIREAVAQAAPLPMLCPKCGDELLAWFAGRTETWIALHPRRKPCAWSNACWGKAKTEHELREGFAAIANTPRLPNPETVRFIEQIIDRIRMINPRRHDDHNQARRQ
jgi:hypothetical protein